MTFGISTISTSSISSATITESGIALDNLGAELQANWDMSAGTSGWSGGAETSVAAVVDMGRNSVLITSIQDGVNDRASLSISGLAVGKAYRVSIVARRGSGITQVIRSGSWGVFSPQFVVSATYQTYEQDIIATSTSGVTSVFAANTTGILGDEVYVSQVSIREIL